VTPLLLWLACTASTGDDSAPTVATDSATLDSDPDSGSTSASSCEPITGQGGQPALVEALPAGSNLLLVSIDTLRKDRVGRYSGLDTTPFLDAWLDQALVLDEHRSCSDWTAPSMLCALTGTTPTEAGYEPHAGTDAVLIDVPEDLDGLTGWLADGGWIPAIVTANAVVAEAQPARVDPRAIQLLDREPAEGIVDAGLAVLDSLRQAGSPWFLHLHFNDPHSPYDPPDAYLDGLEGLEACPIDLTDEAAIVAFASDPDSLSAEDQALVVAHTEVRYQGELTYLDDQLARLLQALQDRGVPDDTLIVLLSDHGEPFLEHGAYTHGTTLHVEEVDAIAAVWAPGLSPGTWSGPTAHQDLTPTVLQALGLQSPSTVTAPVLGTAPADRARHGFRQYRDVPPLHVLTRGTQRLLYGWDGTRAFYELATDPAELTDTYDADAAGVRCLWEHLDPWIALAMPIMGDYAPVDPHP